MNFNPETLSDWMMDKEEVESSLSESDESSQPLSSLLEEERFAQQTLYLDEPNMDEIQVKVRNQLPISQMEQVKHLFYINRAVCHRGTKRIGLLKKRDVMMKHIIINHLNICMCLKELGSERYGLYLHY